MAPVDILKQAPLGVRPKSDGIRLLLERTPFTLRPLCEPMETYGPTDTLYMVHMPPMGTLLITLRKPSL